MRRVPFNINSIVFIKLTATGREFLRRQHEELWDDIVAQSEDKNRWRPAYKDPVEDAAGWSEWHLTELMDKFGKASWYGSPEPPYETNIEIGFKEVPVKCEQTYGDPTCPLCNGTVKR